MHKLTSFALLALSLAACGGPRDAGTAVYGNYEGILPCENCPGVKTELLLAEDGRYRLSQQYLGGAERPVHVTGRWSRSDDIVSLHGPTGEQKLVIENMDSLRLLDTVAAVSADSAGPDYRLRRVEPSS